MSASKTLKLGADKFIARKFKLQENCIQKYECAMMTHTLLQGWIFLTDKHLCFYSENNDKKSTVLTNVMKIGTGKKSTRIKVPCNKLTYVQKE